MPTTVIQAPRIIRSCDGPVILIRKSRERTFTWSMQGNIKKRPGPTAPPRLMRPKRKMTARSYSCSENKNPIVWIIDYY